MPFVDFEMFSEPLDVRNEVPSGIITQMAEPIRFIEPCIRNERLTLTVRICQSPFDQIR